MEEKNKHFEMIKAAFGITSEEITDNINFIMLTYRGNITVHAGYIGEKLDLVAYHAPTGVPLHRMVQIDDNSNLIESVTLFQSHVYQLANTLDHLYYQAREFMPVARSLCIGTSEVNRIIEHLIRVS